MKFTTKRWYSILVICLFLCKFLPVFSQTGSPIITNYSSSGIGPAAQIWGIEQDKNGVFYFATNSGVTKFNGTDWVIYKTPLSATVRSLAINDQGKIFVGATREFGFLKSNPLGNYEYISLSDSLLEKNFNAVLKTIIIGQSVYFLANHQQIFKYENDHVTEVNVPLFPVFRSFLVNKEIWLTQRQKGLARLVNDSVQTLSTEPLPGDIYAMFPIGNQQIMAGTLKNGLFIYDIKLQQWLPFHNQADELLKQGNIYHAILLTNGDIAVATLKKGVIILTAQGKIKYVLDKQSGLINNATYFLKEDSYGDLWIAQEKGISHVELSVPFNHFGIHSGLDGNIQKLTLYQDRLYCGTSSGIFYLPLENKSPWDNKVFKQLSNEYLYNLDYCKIKIPGSNKELLLASFLRNLVAINPKNEFQDIYDVYGCYSICEAPGNPGRVYLGTARGIEILDLTFNQKKVHVASHQKIDNISESIRKIIVNKEGNLWVQTAFNAIYYITVSENRFQIQKNSQLNAEHPGIILTGIYQIDDKIFISSNRGIFSAFANQPLSETNFFQSDKSLGLNFEKDSISVQAMAKDNMGNYWIASSVGLLKYDITHDEIEMSEYKRIQKRPIQFIHVSDELGVAAISEEEIFILNQKSPNNSNFGFKVIFTEAILGDNFIHLNFDGNYASQYQFKQLIPINQNSFFIKFCAPFYQQNKEIKYKYKLEGFDKSWIRSSTNQSANYINLPNGNYTFKVEAENIYNKQSNQAEFSFKISPSWYQKPLSLVVFFILAFFIIWGFVHIYTLNLKKEKIRLNAIISEAVSKEMEQKLAMEKQAGKLFLANRELQKLSLVASKTDNAVMIMDQSGAMEWINEGYTRLYGFSYHELLDEAHTYLLGENANITINDMVNIWYGDRQPIIFENQKKKKNGALIWVQTTLTPILDENKDLKYLIAIDTDISKLKQAEAEIETQKKEIETQRDLAMLQRDEILQQKKEIIDSILYAQRIQRAVFNKDSDLNNFFNQSFVFNKPRDIVSGDFFWVHQNEKQKIIATADCTGHGIPGAFMSMLAFTFLNQIIKEKGIIEPAVVLNQLRDKVIHSLGQKGDENEAKDGLDIAICVINSEQHKICYGAANNRSFIVRKNEVFELEADKMPISIYGSVKQSFISREFIYQPGDILYMFSDGFADQFGGSQGKKYMTSRFKGLLKDISKENYINQKTMLDMEFQRWKGQLNQVDDILIVGIGLE